MDWEQAEPNTFVDLAVPRSFEQRVLNLLGALSQDIKDLEVGLGIQEDPTPARPVIIIDVNKTSHVFECSEAKLLVDGIEESIKRAGSDCACQQCGGIKWLLATLTEALQHARMQ